jgi:hypothetical protein
MVDFKHSDSMNFVTSCHQVSSCVLKAKAGKVWEALKSFNFEKALPSHVKKSTFKTGGPNELGSEFEIEYKDGSVWHWRIIEISENHRAFSYELISAKPEVNFTSMQHHVRLHKVTFDDTTFVEWATDFSNDVNSHIVQDNKFKKEDYFKDLQKLFS